MMYPYKCDPCKIEFDIIKPIRDCSNEEFCPECKIKARRIYSFSQIMVDRTKPEYYHSFGKVVKNKREKEYLMKKHDVVEIGNESPDKMHRTFEKQRNEKRKNSWDKV